MAQKYRKIDPRIWTDEKFRRLTMEGQHLALWLLTTTRLNRCGVVLWSPGLASEETKIPRHRVDTVCDTVCHTMNWVRDKASNTIFFPHWWRYNKPDNASALKGALSDLHDIPANNLKSYIEASFDDLPDSLRTVCHTVYHTVSDTVSPQEQEQEQEQEYRRACVLAQSTNGKSARPTVDEIAAYCQERNNGIDPQAFFDFYEANGWVQGSRGKPVKDWKACVRTWEARRRAEKPTAVDPSTPPRPLSEYHDE